MKMLDLFSGIGGFSLAAQWAGIETIQFCEIDPFCQKVLAKNFAGVPIHDDIRTFDSKPFRGRIDLLTGGFPCQDVSCANPSGKGLDGERSGLWAEMLRIIRECKPSFVVAENVAALRIRGADRVLSDLESAGYTCGAFVVRADYAGAPHRRKRVFIVAYSDILAGLQTDATACTEREERNTWNDALRGVRGAEPRSYWQIHQPPISGVDDGIPYRMERNIALGNSIVPQVVYPILQAIKEAAE